MADERPENGRANGGRFAPGNRVAAGRRRAGKVTPDLLTLADARLRAASTDAPGVRELAADAFAAVARAAAGGDLAAARWLIDRLEPKDSEAVALPALPSPSREPARFLDALAQHVAAGALSAGRAASLSHLARAFLADQQTMALAAELRELAEKVEALEAAAHRPRRVAA